ncbi:hypothetical protein GGR57DRAFT_63335 [Xylariaceae sp. FL1272]|nr:hypothetical protein GGR57DRAFT_63335 [Xylariaceae sp. FL1272]
MGRISPRSSRIAHMEECDENGSVLSGIAPTYAKSVAPSSPRKQQPNMGKSRKDSRRTQSYDSDDSSDSTAHPTAGKKKSSKSRPKESRRSSGPVVVKEKRPPPRSSKTAPMPHRGMSEDAYYTVPQPGLARPRAQTRPGSYYGQSPSRPPIQGAYFHPPGPPGPSFHPPPPSSFGPPSFSGSYGAPPPMGPPHGHMPPLPHGQFHPDLALRFAGRPSSAMGYRQPSNPDLYYDHISDKPSRKSSVSRKVSKDGRDKEDRKRMPPPPRPKSTRPERAPERVPERVVLRPQAPQAVPRRKSVNFDDGEFSDEDVHYTSHRRESGVEYGSSPFKNRRQSQSFPDDPIFDYEDDDYEVPVPQPKARSHSRRDSRMGFGIEDKIRDAARYQDGLAAPSSALTAEALRYKNGGSQPSTRSTESRDESEYKHSATTHTTRSSSGEDDITIKVPMGAVVEVGGARITCKDGGDISLGRNNTSIKGSDRGTVYGDDRRSRSDRSGNRLRASSHAAFARGLPAPDRHKYSNSPLYTESYYDDEYERYDPY